MQFGGRDYDQLTGAGEIASRADEGEIVLEGAIPTPTLPRHRPTFHISDRASPLDPHPGLVDGPCTHRALTQRIFADHGLEHDERKACRAIGFELIGIQRELARAFSNRVRQGVAQVPGSQIDAVALPDVGGCIAGELAPEALEVILQASGHDPPYARRRGALSEGVVGPRGRRTRSPGSRLRRRRPRASGGRSLPLAG